MRRDDYRATGVVMLGLAAATLTGFLRQSTIAYQLGVGESADAFLVAYGLPELALIALPIVLSPALIPLFTQLRSNVGERAAWGAVLRWSGVLFATLLGLSVAAMLAAPTVVRWTGPGLDPAVRAWAVRSLRLMLPALGLLGLATLAGAVLQVYRRFARPALATAAYNLAFILSLFALPVAPPLDRASLGVTFGAGAALVLMLPLLWKHRPPASPSELLIESRDLHAVGQIARLVGPFAAGYAVHHLVLFVDRAMATSLGPGSAAALSYAYHLALVAGQLSGLAVSTALFPRLAQLVASGDRLGARTSLAGALRFVWVVGLPVASGLVLLREPLVRLLFEHGTFDQAATTAVAQPLLWYALAVLADALCQPLWRVVYACRGATTVLGVNSLQTGVRLLANIALSRVMGYTGIAVSAMLGLLVQVVVLAWLVRRRIGNYSEATWWLDMGRITLAGFLAAIAMSVPARLLAVRSPGVIVLAGGGLGLLVYTLALGVMARRSGYFGTDSGRFADDR